MPKPKPAQGNPALKGTDSSPAKPEPASIGGYDPMAVYHEMRRYPGLHDGDDHIDCVCGESWSVHGNPGGDAAVIESIGGQAARCGFARLGAVLGPPPHGAGPLSPEGRIAVAVERLTAAVEKIADLVSDAADADQTAAERDEREARRRRAEDARAALERIHWDTVTQAESSGSLVFAWEATGDPLNDAERSALDLARWEPVAYRVEALTAHMAGLRRKHPDPYGRYSRRSDS